MELKKGYKLTEVGVVPEYWDVEKLGDLRILMTNGFVGTVKTQYTDSDEGIIYIQGYNVEENSFNYNGIKKVTQEFHRQHIKSSLKEGDLLTIQTGDVGLTTIVPKELEGANCHALIITRLKKSKCYSKYFSFYLNSKQGRQRLKEIETGTTMKHVNVGEMLHFYVPVPPLDEQKTIANALSDADALISSLEKLIAKKRSIKQGAMQKLLQPKEGWLIKKFEDVMDGFSSGQTPYRGIKEYYTGNIPWITSGELNYNIITDTIEKITEDAVRKTNLKIIPSGTLLMAITGLEAAGTRGSCAITGIPATTNQSCMALYPKKGKLITKYLFYYYVLHGNKFAFEYCQGTKQQSYTGRIVRKLPITLPPIIDEQIRIAEILSDMDAEITALEAKLEKYKRIKQGMMQNLLTGKIRLIKKEEPHVLPA